MPKGAEWEGTRAKSLAAKVEVAGARDQGQDPAACEAGVDRNEKIGQERRAKDKGAGVNDGESEWSGGMTNTSNG